MLLDVAVSGMDRDASPQLNTAKTPLVPCSASLNERPSSPLGRVGF